MHTLLRRETHGSLLPPLSIAFARPEARYVAGLNAFRIDDLDGWLTVFATAVSLAANATIGLAHEVGQLRQSWHARLSEALATSGRHRPRADAAVLAALEVLPDTPAFHARDLAQRLDRSWRAAQDAVEEPRHRSDQPLEYSPIDQIGLAERVQDLRDRVTCVRVPVVVGQLQIPDSRTVLAGPPGLSQIHVAYPLAGRWLRSAPLRKLWAMAVRQACAYSLSGPDTRSGPQTPLRPRIRHRHTYQLRNPGR